MMTRKKRASDFNLNLLTVIGELKSLRKTGVCLVMQSDIMCGVDEIDPAGVYTSRKADSLINKHVGMMSRTKTKSIHNECVYPMQIFTLGIINGLHVSYICETAETICHDGKGVVHDDKRHDRNITNPELAVWLDGLQLQTRNTGIQMLCKNIWHRVMERRYC